MKKAVNGLLAAITLAASTTALAAPLPTASSGLTPQQISPVGVPMDAIEMHATDGRLMIVPWILGIAGLDLALIGTYWGVYVPNYAQEKASHEGVIINGPRKH